MDTRIAYVNGNSGIPFEKFAVEERCPRKGRKEREKRGKERKGKGKAGRTVARSREARMQPFVSVRRPRVECEA